MTVQKINPTVKIVGEKTITFDKTWQEGMGFRFDVDASGEVSEVDTDDEAMIGELTDNGPFGEH